MARAGGPEEGVPLSTSSSQDAPAARPRLTPRASDRTAAGCGNCGSCQACDGCTRASGWFGRWLLARTKEWADKLRTLGPAPRELWIAYILKFFESYAFFAFSYILVLYLSDEYGFSDTVAGFMYGTFGLVYALSSLATGVAVDKVGVRRALLLGGALLFASRLALALCDSRPVLCFVLFITLPVGCAFGIPVLTLAVKRYTTETNRAIAFSLFFVALNLGAFAAGLMVDFFRTAYPWPPERMTNSLNGGLGTATAIPGNVIGAAGQAAGDVAGLAGAAASGAGATAGAAAAGGVGIVGSAFTNSGALGNVTGAAGAGVIGAASGTASSVQGAFNNLIYGNGTVSSVVGALTNSTIESALISLAGDVTATAIDIIGPFLTYFVRLFDVAPGPLLSPQRALLLTSAIATAFAFSIAFLFLRELQVEDDSGRTRKPTVPRESHVALARELLSSRRFWRFALLIAILTGVRSVVRQLETTFPKYTIREIGAHFPFGAVIALEPIMVIVLLPLVSAFVFSRSTPFHSIMLGAFITCAAPIFLVIGPYTATAVLFVLALAAGEATWTPRLYEYTASIAPPGREGAYAAAAIFPLHASKALAGGVSGLLLDALCPASGRRLGRVMWTVLLLLGLACPVALVLLRPVIERRDPGEEGVRGQWSSSRGGAQAADGKETEGAGPSSPVSSDFASEPPASPPQPASPKGGNRSGSESPPKVEPPGGGGVRGGTPPSSPPPPAVQAAQPAPPGGGGVPAPRE